MSVTLPDGQELVVFAEPGAPAEALPEFAVVCEEELQERTQNGWALRSCLAVDAPLTVYDDVDAMPQAAAQNSFASPTQARTHHGYDRKGRSVVVRQLRFLVQRTRAVDPIEGLRTKNDKLSADLDDLQWRLEDAKRDLDAKEADRKREVGILNEQVHTQQIQLERAEEKRAVAEAAVREQRRIVVSYEEDMRRISDVLGAALMDRLLDRANTTSAEIQRREVIEALQNLG